MAALVANTAVSLTSTPSAAVEMSNATQDLDTSGKQQRSGLISTEMKAGETNQVGPVEVSGGGVISSKNELKGDGTQTETNKAAGEISIEVDGKAASTNVELETGAAEQTTTEINGNITTGTGTYTETSATAGINRGPPRSVSPQRSNKLI